MPNIGASNVKTLMKFKVKSLENEWGSQRTAHPMENETDETDSTNVKRPMITFVSILGKILSEKTKNNIVVTSETKFKEVPIMASVLPKGIF